MRPRSVPFWISAFIHGLVIGVGGLFLIKPPQFAMDSGHNSIEVNLVAAAPDPVPPPPPVPQPVEPADTQPPKPDDVVVPVAPPTPPVTLPPPQPVAQTRPPPAPVPPKPHRKPTVAKGDSSSPQPGKDAITASSEGGAIMDTKPDYLSNPPPIYPESLRLNRQEGVVVLQVIVNEEGHPDSIEVQSTSGFALFDQSAVTAVHRWRFRPAMLGSMKMKSRVIIPVRFQLKD